MKQEMAVSLGGFNYKILEIPIRNWNLPASNKVMFFSADIRDTYKELKLM